MLVRPFEITDEATLLSRSLPLSRWGAIGCRHERTRTAVLIMPDGLQPFCGGAWLSEVLTPGRFESDKRVLATGDAGRADIEEHVANPSRTNYAKFASLSIVRARGCCPISKFEGQF